MGLFLLELTEEGELLLTNFCAPKSKLIFFNFCAPVFWCENRMGGFRKGGFSNNRFVLKPDVAIVSEVSILSKNSLAITDCHAKKTQHIQLFENPLPGNPPFAIPKF